eukprot:12416978-Karenia_brevis.AAC.1
MEQWPRSAQIFQRRACLPLCTTKRVGLKMPPVQSRMAGTDPSRSGKGVWGKVLKKKELPKFA